MPNWCYNEMTINAGEEEGAQQQLNDFINTSVKSKKCVSDSGDIYYNEELTFQGVVPRPKELDITAGGSVNDGIAYLKAKDGDFSDLNDFIKREWTYKGKNKLFDKDTPIKEKYNLAINYLEDKLDVNELTESRLAIENINKHGHKDWYWWAVDKWGTKWDASTNSYDHDVGWVQIIFDTAWSPPEPWILAVSKKFPLLEITVRVTEESDAFMGYICARNGKLATSYAEPEMPN